MQVQKYENWFRLSAQIHEALTPAFIAVIHNDAGVTSYKGLPKNPTDLYIELSLNHKTEFDKLLKKKLISKKQYDLIFPISKTTVSDAWDITLAAVIIRNTLSLTSTYTSWIDKNPPSHDNSILANVVRGRELRNYLSHVDPSTLDGPTFNTKWNEVERVVNGLKFNFDFKALLTAPLDTRSSYIQSKIILHEKQLRNIKRCLTTIIILLTALILSIFFVMPTFTERRDGLNALQKTSENLKTYYQSVYGSRVISTLGNRVLNKRIYVDLNVVSEDDFQSHFRSSDLFHYRKQFEHINLNVVKMEELLHSSNEKFTVIRGIAGIGKTHLMEEIALRWANGSLWNHLEYLFLVKCREVNHQQFTSYIHMFNTIFPRIFQNTTYEDLSKYSNETLIILDGLDELGLTKKYSKTKYILDLVNPMTNIFPSAKVIVTGRPESISHFLHHFSEFNRKQVEILGFNEQVILHYINETFPKNVTTAKRIKDVIEGNRNFRLLARIPIYLQSICIIYASYTDLGTIETITELYVWKFAMYMKKHLKYKDMDALAEKSLYEIFEVPSVKEMVIKIAELSFEMFIQGVAVFEKESGEVNRLYENMEELGFVSRTKTISGNVRYQFFHLTFQEFMVAIHLCINEHLFCSVEIKEDSEVLPLYAGLQGGVIKNSKSPGIVRKIAKELNFVINSARCDRKINTATWYKLLHEYSNKIETKPFFWNSNHRYSYFKESFIFQLSYFVPLFHRACRLHSEKEQKYNYYENTIDEFCLSKDSWRRSALVVLKFKRCAIGVSISTKVIPCVRSENTTVKKNQFDIQNEGVRCFTYSDLKNLNTIKMNQVSYLYYDVYDGSVREHGILISDIMYQTFFPVNAQGELTYNVRIYKSFPNYLKAMKDVIIKHKTHFKVVSFTSVIEYECSYGHIEGWHNMTARYSQNQRITGNVNEAVIIHSVCCPSVHTPCIGMSFNLYKRFIRNNYFCWEERREVIQF